MKKKSGVRGQGSEGKKIRSCEDKKIRNWEVPNLITS